MENSAGQLDKKMYPGTFKLGAAYNGGKFANAAGVRSSANYLIYVQSTKHCTGRGQGLTAGLMPQ